MRACRGPPCVSTLTTSWNAPATGATLACRYTYLAATGSLRAHYDPSEWHYGLAHTYRAGTEPPEPPMWRYGFVVGNSAIA